MNTRIACGLAALAVAAGAAQAQITFLGSFGGKDYYRNSTNLSWSDAAAAASSFLPGAHLVAINSAAEQNFLIAQIPHVVNFGPVMWIGLNKSANPNGGIGALSTWITGEPVTFTNWASDTPFNDPTRNFASWNWNVDGAWNLLGNEGQPFNLKQSIIEVVPTPGAAAVLGLAALAGLRRRR